MTRTTTPPRISLTVASTLLVATLAGPASALVQSTAPYTQVSQRTQDFTNFNVETTRGMVAIQEEQELWAINTHGSRLVRVDMSDHPFETESWPTLQNPIALAEWDGYILVLGGATHALAFHDPATGLIVDLVDLGEDAPDPGDILVDPDSDHAYVSSMGKNQVVRIDLSARGVDRVWPVESMKPRFLHLDPGTSAGASDNVLYVTPMLSGNNSTVANRPNFPEESMVVDLDDATTDLPDEDLFRIPVNTTDGQAAEAVFRRAGTILTSHGRNPDTGKYWMLSVDLNNKDEDDLGIDTEPELKGVFAENELLVLPDPRTISQLTDVAATTPISLDALHSHDPEDIVASNPWDLLFHEATGWGFISSPTGDLVRVLGKNGETVFEIPTGEGSIPRSLGWWLVPGDPGFTILLVYCWGTNEIKGYTFLPSLSTTPLFTVSLGFDPTPPGVAAGREIFYDANRSLDSRTTCGTCHVGGEYDGLAWPLADVPRDHKDVMVTQNLKSIEDTFPFHWRGERRLIDFNDAFVGLLGGSDRLDTTPDGEFDQFQAFVFSMQNMANPYANVRRELDTVVADGSSPSDGQWAFQNLVTVGANAKCVDCHALPNGTNNDFITNPGDKATFMNMEVAHYRDLAWKNQEVVEVVFQNPFTSSQETADRARGGFGVLHNGIVSNFAELVQNFLDANELVSGAMTEEDRDDITSFLQQFDRGISRAAHKAYLVEMGTAASVVTDIEDTLLDQADVEWIDVVALGTYPVSGVPTPISWYYDPSISSFRADHPSALTATASDFRTQANLGLATNAIFGVPAGMGRYFAADPDYDGATGVQEAIANTDPFDPDVDGDGYPDGYEIVHGSLPKRANSIPSDSQAPSIVDFTLLHETAAVAVYRLESDEPCDYTVTWWPQSDPAGDQGDHVRTVRSSQPGLIHTVTLQGMLSGFVATTMFFEDQPHDIRVEITDLSGNTTTDSTSYTVEPDPILEGFATPLSAVVTDLTVVGATPTGSTLDMQVRARLQYRGGVLTNDPGLPEMNLLDWRVLAQVLIGTPDPAFPGEYVWTTSTNVDAKTGNPIGPGGSEQHDGVAFGDDAYDALPGSFVLSHLTDSDGEVVIDFAQSGLVAGQVVALNIVGLLPETQIDSGNPTGPNGEPNYVGGTNGSIPLLALYKFAATAPENRIVSASF